MPATVEALRNALPEGTVSTDPDDLAAHAHDWWPLALLRSRRGEAPTLPSAVVRPRSTGEVAEVLRWAQETMTAVVPFGGGSGVSGGAEAIEGAIALDTRAMDGVLAIDPVALTVTAQAGIMGRALEEHLEREGFTLGHFPQSIDISTLGGWIAARSAGQKSARYGRLEEMILGLEVVLPGGDVVRTRPVPATAAGPDLARVFIGSEGTLGVVTEATLAIRPAPATVEHGAYRFETFAAGLEALRLVERQELRPAVMRLYDETDVGIAFRDAPERPEGALLILRFEGDDLADAEERAVRTIVRAGGGSDLGPSLAERWWEHRNDAVGTFRQIMLNGLLGPAAAVDTMEIAGLWPVNGLYDAVRGALGAHADVVGCHASHPYPQGACLYFTFVFIGSSDEREVEARYRAAWNDAASAALAAGATVTHHHGVGLLKAPWLREELGNAFEVLRAVKRALDPAGIMNPGKLGL
ncbi:MAG: FAD-binding oxidoreductase [Actinomycetota bacterium]